MNSSVPDTLAADDHSLQSMNQLAPPVNRPVPSMNRLAPQFIQAEMLGNLIGVAFVAIPSLVGLVVVWFVEGLSWIFYLSLAGYCLMLLFCGFLCFVWPRIAYQTSSWRLSDESLEIHRGVFWKHRLAIPLGRVQHADVSQGPLLRYFDLGKLTIHTAGTSSATIELGGLAHHDALALRDSLVQQTQSRSVL